MLEFAGAGLNAAMDRENPDVRKFINVARRRPSASARAPGHDPHPGGRLTQTRMNEKHRRFEPRASRRGAFEQASQRGRRGTSSSSRRPCAMFLVVAGLPDDIVTTIDFYFRSSGTARASRSNYQRRRRWPLTRVSAARPSRYGLEQAVAMTIVYYIGEDRGRSGRPDRGGSRATLKNVMGRSTTTQGRVRAAIDDGSLEAARVFKIDAVLSNRGHRHRTGEQARRHGRERHARAEATGDTATILAFDVGNAARARRWRPGSRREDHDQRTSSTTCSTSSRTSGPPSSRRRRTPPPSSCRSRAIEDHAQLHLQRRRST